MKKVFQYIISLILFIPLVVLFGCENDEDSINIDTSDAVLIHHEIIIENNSNLPGAFYINTGAMPIYYFNPTVTMPIVDGVFETPEADWVYGEMPFFIYFYYSGFNGVNFGCANIEINTLVDGELYHTHNFVVGMADSQLACEINGTGINYEIIIE